MEKEHGRSKRKIPNLHFLPKCEVGGRGWKEENERGKKCCQIQTLSWEDHPPVFPTSRSFFIKDIAAYVLLAVKFNVGLMLPWSVIFIFAEHSADRMGSERREASGVYSRPYVQDGSTKLPS